MQMGKQWREVRPLGLLLFALQPHPLSSSGSLLFRIIQNFSEVLVCAALSEPFKCHFLCLEYSIHTLTHTCMCACICVTNSYSSSGLSENLPLLSTFEVRGLLPAPAPLPSTSLELQFAELCSSRKGGTMSSRFISNAQHLARCLEQNRCLINNCGMTK